MGRELQKRKNRSSISKVRHKPKSKKRILSHPIIAANWDKTQTLAQNYQRLGLTAKLNKNTGGLERTVSHLERAKAGDHDVALSHSLTIDDGSRGGTKLELSEARVERDLESGEIIRVIEDSSRAPKANPLNDPLNGLDSESESEENLFSLQNQHSSTKPLIPSTSNGKTATIRALESEASKPAAKYKRKQPQGEIDFVEFLFRHRLDKLGQAGDVDFIA